jgi:putative ABC transport system substrate-binding protein
MTDRRLLMKALAGAAFLGMTGANAAKSFTIGYLALLPGENRMSFMARFMRRLDELGYKNGQNLRLIYRSAEGQPQLLSGLASELVGMKPDVLVTGLGTVAARAGKTVSGGVPVVFMAVGDPVGANIVESLARPGGNVTGLSDLAAHIQGRRLALLREFAPAATIVAVVLNPGTPYTALAYKELEQAAKIVNIELRAFEVRSPEEITPQLEAIKVGGAGALAILEDPLTLSQRNQIAIVASRLGLPAVYGYREFVEAGGLMSYGTDHGAQWRRGAEIVDLILKGAKPADIPVDRDGHQPQDRKGTRYRDLTVVARYRRRSDRVNRLNVCFWRKAFSRSACSQRRSTSSEARNFFRQSRLAVPVRRFDSPSGLNGCRAAKS